MAIDVSQKLQHRWQELEYFLQETTLPFQTILDHITILLTEYFQVDACSLYAAINRSVVLVASKGLYPTSIYRTRLDFGSGIIGNTLCSRKPKSLANMRTSSIFVYCPGTGEERYSSMLSVPIFYKADVVGVVALQTKDERFYTPREICDLEHYAAAIAGYLFTAYPSIAESAAIHSHIPEKVPENLRLNGKSSTTGYAEGHAHIHRPTVNIERYFAENPTEENQKLTAAIAHMLDDLTRTTSQDEEQSETRNIIESFKLMASDEVWHNRVRRGINEGLSAQTALQQTYVHYAGEITASKNPYMLGRLSDIDDLTNRLMSYLVDNAPDPTEKLLRDVNIGASKDSHLIVVATRIGPIEVLDYYRAGLVGLILEDAQENSHATILAKSLNVPVISGVVHACERIPVRAGVLMDTENKVIWLNPDQEAYEDFRVRRMHYDRASAMYEQIKLAPAITQDGVSIDLGLNVALHSDLDDIAMSTGVGLYRSEVPFLLHKTIPSVEVQEALYRDLFTRAAGKEINFRLMDIGGDKGIENLISHTEANPSMGWRAIRLALDIPLLMREQVRALIRAAEGRAVTILAPMVANIHEIQAIKRIIRHEVSLIEKNSVYPQTQLKFGVMVEIPSLSWQIESVIKEVDALFIGSNDLFQFFYAFDRSNHNIHKRYSVFDTAFLSFIRHHVFCAEKSNTPLSVCGEMAATPLGALTLMGLGVRKLSVPRTVLPAIKLMIRSLELQPFTGFLHKLLASDDPKIQLSLQSYARDHDIII
ncbi:MAG: GAF domain-containing protein [Alphaproteobacteria bacterium]|nr:MAG: GAF domain-containing protein [Alphaproteobacteria bacterium]